jgi:hypothetical protein
VNTALSGGSATVLSTKDRGLNYAVLTRLETEAKTSPFIEAVLAQIILPMAYLNYSLDDIATEIATSKSLIQRYLNEVIRRMPPKEEDR